jgi:predicted nucleotide-binding protein
LEECHSFLGAKKAPEKPKEKVWTEKDDAARKIQTKFRQYRAKKALEKKKKEKEDYNDLMDKLEKEVNMIIFAIVFF